MIRLLALSLVAACLLSCGSSTPQTRKKEPAPAFELIYDDAFASFEGTTVALGEQVTLRREPVGLAEARALVALGRTEWVIHSLPGGSEEKTATASLVVQRGGDAGNVRIEAGESGTVLGVTIEVHEAGEVYEESSMRWVQFAKVTFSVAP